MFKKKTMKDMDLRDKKVFVRADFNVPLQGDKVIDGTRIIAALPTIEYLIKENAAIILASHLGRPGGEYNAKLSLKPVVNYLKDFANAQVTFANDCIGPRAELAAKEIGLGEILVLENTRFHRGEEENDPEMGRKLASLADVFINDAFGTAHRSHASNVGIAKHLPSAAGLLLEKEIEYLGNTIANPEKPFTVILGGAKVSGKIGVIKNLIKKADQILIGGGMANTFFASQGYDMADSLVEIEVLDLANELLQQGRKKIILPTDVVISDNFSNTGGYKIIKAGPIPAGWRIMDIGPQSLIYFKDFINISKTIVWNGPMGVFEFPVFAKGTFSLAEIIAESNALTIIGGGDSSAAVNQAGVSEKITHISTGGGASLKMLEGAVLPGLEALDDR